MTLLELMLALALASILATIAVVTYGSAMDRTRISRAVADITEIQLLIVRFTTNQGRLPVSLAEAGAGGRVDPWGNAYRYLSFEGPVNTSLMRKDRNLVPINSDFDLYSAGPDGQTRPPLTATPSRDAKADREMTCEAVDGSSVHCRGRIRERAARNSARLPTFWYMWSISCNSCKCTGLRSAASFRSGLIRT